MVALSKDLNSLEVFEAIWLYRNVSAAAKHLGLSQPGVSHALNRLRSDFCNELFVRGHKGMVPTPKAIELHPRISKLLETLKDVYAESSEEEILSSEGSIRIATTDYFEHVILPKLLPICSQEIPNTKIICRPTIGELPKLEMERGEIDFAVAGFFGELPEGLVTQNLFSEEYLCIARKAHPLVKNGLNLENFLAAEHLLMSPLGDLHGAVDVALAAKKLKRKVKAGLLSFHSVPYIVSQTDYIATIPARMACYLAPLFGLNCFAPPIKIKGYTVRCIWHERINSSILHSWFRKKMKNICDSLPKNSEYYL